MFKLIRLTSNVLLYKRGQNLKRKRRKKRLRLSEEDYAEILNQPIGTGIFVYHNAEHEVSQLKAKRSSVEAYRQATSNSTQNKNKVPSQCNHEPLLKAGVIGAIGLIILIMGH